SGAKCHAPELPFTDLDIADNPNSWVRSSRELETSSLVGPRSVRCSRRTKSSRSPVRPDPVGDFGTPHVVSHLQIVVRLEVHPELRRGSEIPRQSESRVRGDRPLATNECGLR